MQLLTQEWVEKAEGDFATLQREIRARRLPNYDAACFHVQQCLEKYLKARINEVGFVINRTHDLSDLLDDILQAEPSWASLRTVLDGLTKYAVLYRYPGYDAAKTETKDAIKNCREIRRVIRISFGLPV